MGRLIRFSALLLLSGYLVQASRYPQHKNTNQQYVATASQQVPQQVVAAKGYNYQAPAIGLASVQRPQSVARPAQAAAPNNNKPVEQPKAAASEAITAQQVVSPVTVSPDDARSLQHHHMAQVQAIDVACGKERMTVRISFDQAFNGIVYAKGYYNDSSCRFVSPNSGQRMYQFEMRVGACGVAFRDAGLTSGGQAYLEGLLVIILEPGVQEAWDTARRIRCLWEGNIDQTVTYPLSVNMLDSQDLIFSGDTASATLEIQNGRGPRAPVAQGLVRIGDLLTAVVTVVGDADFDLLVRNCVATDGTPNNRIVLSDNLGCATKPKLMGGWQKQRNPGNILAYSYLSAFKFPDIMDLFLECTVSLCKGACEECPNFTELHVHNHGDGVGNAAPGSIDVRVGSRVKRSAAENGTDAQESLRLRRVVHVVSADDLPEFLASGSSHPTVLSGSEDCFSLVTVVASVFVALVLVLTTAVVVSLLRRGSGRDDTIKFYGPAHRA